VKAKDKRFLTVQDLADQFGCSRWKAYRMVKEGIVPSITIAGLLRIPAEALDALAQKAMDRTPADVTH
jgi:excisionase family DNA binding protein